MTVLSTSAHLDTIRHYAKSLGAKLVISFEWPDKTIEIGQRAKPGAPLPPQRPHKRLADLMRNARDQRVSHAEGAMPVAHARVCPPSRKALQLVELVGDKTTYSQTQN